MTTVVEARWAAVRYAAVYSGLSERTIHRMITDGKLVGHRPTPGRLLIDLRALDEVIKGSAGLPSTRGTRLNG
jgi:hypothetical protein